MARRTKYCRDCGEQLNAALSVCESCGARQHTSSGKQKSAALAAVLSLLITGVGQLYLGKVLRGVGFFFGGIALAVVLAGTDAAALAIFAPVAAAVDAAVQAGKVNSGR